MQIDLQRLSENRKWVGALLVACVGLFSATNVFSADLLRVYRDARSNDAVYASAQLALEAGRERLPQGRALILPTLSLSGSAGYTDADVRPGTPNAVFIPRKFNSNAWTVTLNQPLYRAGNIAQYRQAQAQVSQSEAQFGQASQDLILRVAQAYFDVLAAQDSLAFIQAQKSAISEQLAQARRNFEVGTATITDTHEAQVWTTSAPSTMVAIRFTAPVTAPLKLLNAALKAMKATMIWLSSLPP